MKAKLVSIALLAIITLSAIAVINPFGFALPNPPPKADSMWISTDSATGDPTKNTIDGSVVGLYHTFNVYVWLNVSAHTVPPDAFADLGANSWSFFLVYRTDMLKNVSCAYTGAGKSLWSKALPTTPLTPSWGIVNDSFGYCLFGESLNGGAELANMGSCAVITFNVTAAPGKFQTLTCGILLDQTKPFSTTVLDYAGGAFNVIPIGLGNGLYKWVWTAPPKAAFLLSLGDLTLGGTTLSAVGTTFTETVQINVDAGWGCIAANFYLTNDNKSLITITNIVKGALWGNGVFDNTTSPGDVNGALTLPSSTPSGTVDLATITWKIMNQGIDPIAYIAHLAFDNSTGLTYLTDSPGPGRIPATILGPYTVTVKGQVTKISAALVVSSTTMGPMPCIGQLFNVTVKIVNMSYYWCFIGLDFRLAYDPTLLTFVQSFEGPFLPYYSNMWQSLVPPGSIGTWFYDQQQPADMVYPVHDLVGDLILPNATGWWPTVDSVYPNCTTGLDSTVAIIEFRVAYQCFEVNITSGLNIVDEHWVGIVPSTLNTTQDIVYLPFASPVNGVYTIATNSPERQIDLVGGAVNDGYGPIGPIWPFPYPPPPATIYEPPYVYYAFPTPFGGQGPNQPMDIVFPQSLVYLATYVTYNYWPVQTKDVGFEIEGPFIHVGGNYYIRSPSYRILGKFSNVTDSNGVATLQFRMPWPCDNPDSITGVWKVTATVTIGDTVVSDTMMFYYERLVYIYEVSTDKYQYNHFEHVKVEVEYQTHAQMWYPALFAIVLVDNLSVPIAWCKHTTCVGGATFCTWKESCFTRCLIIPKWAFTGIGYVKVSVYDKDPTIGGEPWCPQFPNGPYVENPPGWDDPWDNHIWDKYGTQIDIQPY
jgi:hypothetical protein